MTIFAPIGNEGIQVAANRKDFMQRLNEATTAGKGLTGLLSNALTLKNRYAVNPNMVAAQKAQLDNQAAMNKAQAPLQGALQQALLGQQQEKVPLMQAQAYKMRHPGNTAMDTINALYAGYSNKNLPIALRNAYGQKLNAMNKSGISLSTNPSGGVTFSTGGTGQGGLPMIGNDGNPVAIPKTSVTKIPSRGGLVQATKNEDGKTNINYSLTTGQRTALGKIQGAEAENKVLSTALRNAFSPYQGTGVVQFTKDLFNQDDPTSQKRLVNYLAAQSLMREGSANRARLAQIEGGKENLKQLDKTWGNLPPVTMSRLHNIRPNVWALAQMKANQILNQAAETRINTTGAGLNVVTNNPPAYFNVGDAPSNKKPLNNVAKGGGGGVASGSGGKIIVKDKNGNKFYLPKSQLQDALKQGYSRG